MLLLSFASFALGGKVTLEMADAKIGQVKAVFFDFDQTLTIDKLSEEVRQAACTDAEYPACDYITEGGLGDGNMMITAFESKFVEENQIESFGGKERLEKIIATLDRLRDNGTPVIIVSTSWYPITEEQWKNYLFYASEMLGLGFKMEEIVSLADPGPGKSADKGAKIQEFMDDMGLTFEEAMFSDDSGSNIASAVDVCNTIHLVVRIGLDDTDRAYIETLTGASPVAAKEGGILSGLKDKLFGFFGHGRSIEGGQGGRVAHEIAERARMARLQKASYYGDGKSIEGRLERALDKLESLIAPGQDKFGYNRYNQGR